MTPDEEPATCSASRNPATGERCGSPEVVGFGVHVTTRDVSGILNGSSPHPEIYLQPRCAEHLKRNEESDRKLRERGPSRLLLDSGFAGAAVGTLWIVRDQTS